MTCSCSPHAAALQTPGQTATSARTFHRFALCLPSSPRPKGSVLFFLPANVTRKSRGERFPPPTSPNPKPTRAPRPRCCLNFTLRLDFHPFRAGLVYTGCGVREITVCVRASAGLGVLEPPQANLKLPAWKIRLPFSPFVPLTEDRDNRSGCVIAPPSPQYLSARSFEDIKNRFMSRSNGLFSCLCLY